jgi:hypothetical protein
MGTAALAIILGLPVVAGAADSSAPQPHNLALLIGAAHYKFLPEVDQLKGPDNDIVLMRGLLADRGFQVTQLGGAVSQPQPTRAAIIAAMQHLAEQANKGDFVFLLFSGHGSQQPEAAATGYPSKPDGMDETILPTDVRSWDGTAGSVTGALLDHEMGSLIHAIRNKGVFVWAVFDSCHSATMTRAAHVSGEHDRRILPTELGVPAGGGQRAVAVGTAKASAAPASFIAPVALAPGAGGYAAFYAAQTTEETPELALPANEPNSKVYGLFSFTLAQAILAAPAASYRQIAQQILQLYAAMNRESPTPLFEGDLDLPAFGSGTVGHPQWQILPSSSGLTLTAGLLNGVGADAQLLVLKSATDPDAAAVGVVRVERALETTSHVVWMGQPHPAQPPTGAFARLVASGVNFSVRVARPLVCREGGAATSTPTCAATIPGADAETLAIVAKAFDDHAVDFPANLSLVDPGEVADIRPLLYHERLWLAPPGGQLVTEGPAQTYSVAVKASGSADPGAAQTFRQSLFGALAREARAINLARVATQPGMNTSVGLKVTFSVAHPGTAGNAGMTAVATDAVPTLRDGDQLVFQLTNQGTQAIDVTMLDIGARFGIAPVYPLNGESNRLTPGASIAIPGTIEVKDGDSGRDTMLVIAVPGQPGQERQDFSALAQSPLTADRSAKTANGSRRKGVSGLLWQAAFGSGAGARVLRTSDPAQIFALSWNSAPRNP